MKIQKLFQLFLDNDDENMREIRQLAGKIRTKKKLMKNEQRLENTKKPTLPRTSEPKKRERSVSRLKREFTELGVDMTGTDDANFASTEKKRFESNTYFLKTYI